ncbi:MAG: hypothetical protein Q3976_04375 [Corynebacterium sp.]|nr:hypothetical protein [Corynebacterium sp.]
MAHYDLYKSIGLSRNASTQELNKQLIDMLQNPPLSNPGGADELTVALQVLGDEGKRRYYDEILADPSQPDIGIAQLRKIAVGENVSSRPATIAPAHNNPGEDAPKQQAPQRLASQQQNQGFQNLDTGNAFQFSAPGSATLSGGQIFLRFALEKGSYLIWILGVIIAIYITAYDYDEVDSAVVLGQIGIILILRAIRTLLYTLVADLLFRFVRSYIRFQKKYKDATNFDE